MQTGMTQLSLFQFTPLHERQPTGGAENTATQVFQFTPLYERRRLPLHRLASRRRYFNSRLYMRGNLIDDHSGNPPLLFQFTPLHERQRKAPQVFKNAVKFQFTPLHERQLANSRISWWRVYFNSRLYMRGNSHGCERQLP